MDQTRWTARALLSTSMALGILSVICATSLQRKIAVINDATSVRLWLSCRRTSRESVPGQYGFFTALPLESSISALQVSKAPNTWLHLALVMFIAGFGDYLLFLWLYNVDGSNKYHLKIFIFFVTFISLGGDESQGYKTSI